MKRSVDKVYDLTLGLVLVLALCWLLYQHSLLPPHYKLFLPWDQEFSLPDPVESWVEDDMQKDTADELKLALVDFARSEAGFLPTAVERAYFGKPLHLAGRVLYPIVCGHHILATREYAINQGRDPEPDFQSEAFNMLERAEPKYLQAFQAMEAQGAREFAILPSKMGDGLLARTAEGIRELVGPGDLGPLPGEHSLTWFTYDPYAPLTEEVELKCPWPVGLAAEPE